MFKIKTLIQYSNNHQGLTPEVQQHIQQGEALLDKMEASPYAPRKQEDVMNLLSLIKEYLQDYTRVAVDLRRAKDTLITIRPGAESLSKFDTIERFLLGGIPQPDVRQVLATSGCETFTGFQEALEQVASICAVNLTEGRKGYAVIFICAAGLGLTDADLALFWFYPGGLELLKSISQTPPAVFTQLELNQFCMLARLASVTLKAVWGWGGLRDVNPTFRAWKSVLNEVQEEQRIQFGDAAVRPSLDIVD